MKEKDKIPGFFPTQTQAGNTWEGTGLHEIEVACDHKEILLSTLNEETQISQGNNEIKAEKIFSFM